jgi:hypothetical protein
MVRERPHHRSVIVIDVPSRPCDARDRRVAVVGRLSRRTAHLVHDTITVVLQTDRIR